MVAAYAAGAWLAVDVSSTVLPQLGFPEWTVSAVVLGAVLLFPAVVALAWAFDLTGRGIERTVPAAWRVDPEANEATSEAAETPARPWVRWSLGAAFVLVVGGGWALWLSGAPQAWLAAIHSEPAATRPRSREKRVVAVRPIKAIRPAGGEGDYLANGLTEALATALMRVEGLRVVSPAAVGNLGGAARVDAGAAGRALGVGWLVAGSVRRGADRVRVNVYATNARTGERALLASHRSAAPGERMFDLQGRLAVRATRRLAERLGIDAAIEPPDPGTPDAAAHRAYIEGLYADGRKHWHERTRAGIAKSIALLETAIERDPDFARAHAALAESHILMGYLGAKRPGAAYPAAKRHAGRALAGERAPASAWNAKAYVAFAFDWEFAAAERAFRRAIARNPNYAPARHWYGWYLAAMGRFDAALAQLREARRLRPTSPAIRVSLGRCYAFADRPREAIAVQKRVLAEHEGLPLARVALALAHMQAGAPDRAVAALPAAEEANGSPAVAATRAYALARAGRRAGAAAALDALATRAKRGYVPGPLLARAQLGLGDTEAALASLERGLDQRCERMTTLAVAAPFDPLRGDQRFRSVLRRVGLDRVSPKSAGPASRSAPPPTTRPGGGTQKGVTGRPLRALPCWPHQRQLGAGLGPAKASPGPNIEAWQGCVGSKDR